MRKLLTIALAGIFGVAAACSTSQPGIPSSSSKTLRVLAGSELKDVEPLLPDLEKATGYRVQLSYVGSLDGAERIAAGDRAAMAWFSTGKYLSLLQAAPVAGSRPSRRSCCRRS